MACSVWTHAPKWAIEKMLDAVAASRTDVFVFLASFLRPSRLAALPPRILNRLTPGARRHLRYYEGSEWVLRSTLDQPGGQVVAHDFLWIQSACRRRGLRAQIVPR